MPAGTEIITIHDAVVVIAKILDLAQHEIVFITSPSLLSIAGTYDTVETATRLIENGGVIRGITTLSRANLAEARMLMHIGLDLRHGDQPRELSLFVADKRYSMSGINAGVDKYTFDTTVNGFWSEDPTYAKFLFALFECAWSQAMPAEERIRELEHGTGKRDSA
ncbi:MAG: hypothetical protein ACXV6K_06580 [Halobacteriota archaeon]